ncbi:YueI family protein [Bacillus sp. DTU_2020_1000418_1_SI_GHA_SEK_038]|uniref:YueI family protein n=1 Tax=Bacillus sp. DTU_2020_1000418_1_SI_GHA_SEK_038 TaxID=3077585 RepID=UPI0028E686DC|nr:YueI family protein [Bacillus sp. DTU_2020_1000418_1_SI_GHA_SEK_038]WNS76027.1 YueI family protein [Bacillus sp. DTU_2020_1000418_1_SI_GHA_SEK_038]
MSNNIDDYILQGIHGQKETNPDERRKFLGTLRERIVIALKQSQIRENGIYPQVEDALKKNKGAHLYLNGNMSYEELSKYTKIASKYNVAYTMVTNKDYNSEIGLALAYDYAIDKEEIYVKMAVPIKKAAKKKKGLFSLFSKR